MEGLWRDLKPTETDAKTMHMCVCVFLKQGSISLIKEICDPPPKIRVTGIKGIQSIF